MGHLAEENSISIGFCGGFYCHMGCNAASEGLYGLPRKISGASCRGSPAEEKKRSSGLPKRTSNKLLSVTVLCSRPDLFFHVTLFPPSSFIAAFTTLRVWIWSGSRPRCLWMMSTRHEEECELNPLDDGRFWRVSVLIKTLIWLWGN